MYPIHQELKSKATPSMKTCEGKTDAGKGKGKVVEEDDEFSSQDELTILMNI